MLIQQGWQRDKLDTAEDRASVQFGWSEDDLATQRERWDIMRDLQREQMEASYEYQEAMLNFRDKDIELMKDSMKLQADQHAKTSLWENLKTKAPLWLMAKQ